MDTSMAADVTTGAAVIEQTSNMTQWIVFVVAGGLVFCLNAPIFATIMRFGALRSEKQYLMIAFLALADASGGFGYLYAGIYRIYLELTEQHTLFATPWACFMTVHNVVWVWSDTASTLMLVVVGVDRLISVLIPLQYLGFTKNYAQRLIASAFAYSFLSGVAGIVSSYRRPEVADQSINCYMTSAFSADWFSYYGSINTTFAFSSIGVYLVIGLIARTIYKKKLQKLMANAQASRVMKKQAEQQRRMTGSLAISGLFTFFFYCVPYTLGTYLILIPGMAELSMYVWVTTLLNPMANAFIYLARHREMRTGVHALFTGKPMAPNLQSWLTNQRHSTRSIGQSLGGPSRVAPANLTK